MKRMKGELQALCRAKLEGKPRQVVVLSPMPKPWSGVSEKIVLTEEQKQEQLAYIKKWNCPF